MRSARYWKTARHAAASFTALVLLLITMYAQNRSSRFTASFIGFRRALHYEEAKEASTFEEVWKWFEMFTNSIAADTLEQINANCGYNKPNLQDVNIDGTEYKLFDPQYQFGPCENYRYLNDPDEKVYLSDTGNHELKTVGVFHGRSISTLSRDQEKLVQNNEFAKLDAVTDARVIEVCEVSPWDKPCVLKDGFADSKVSSLSWNGEVIDDFYAFNVGSVASILLPSKDRTSPQFKSYDPCFNNVSGVLTSPAPNVTLRDNPMEGYEGCHPTWVTPGYEVRKHCLDAQVTQADAKYAFMISILNYTSLTEMRNLLYGCDATIALRSEDLKNAYITNDEFVTNSLEGGKLHGLFINTDSQGFWIEDSTQLVEQMQFLKLIDRSTRSFSVIAITRNDGNEDLYYSKISFNFKMLVDGKIILRMESSYIPIVQYFYGIDDYPWVFREILIFESFYLLVLILFTIRELYQHYKQMILFVTVLSIRGTAKIGDIMSMGGNCDPNLKDGEADSNHEVDDGTGTHDQRALNTDNVEHEDDGNGDAPSNGRNHLEIGEIDSEIDEEDMSAREVHQQATRQISTGTSLENMTFIPDDSNWYDILDFLTIVVGFILVYYRVWYVELCYDAINYLEELDRDEEPASELSRHEDSFGVTIEQFADIEDCEYAVFVISMTMVLMCIMQFFRYLEFDARFGIVARTLRQSLWVLLPVLIVFTTVLSTYAVMGTVLYGKFLSEWSTFYNSLGSLFLLILGEFEGYPRMRSVSSSLTGLFFWSFVSFVILVLFNMVLAIILTVYDETYKQIILEAETKLELDEMDDKKVM